jgi:transketolase
VSKAQNCRKNGKRKFEEYGKAFPKEGEQLNQTYTGQLPEGWDKDLPTFKEGRVSCNKTSLR